MINLEQIEADLAGKNRLPYGVDDAVVRELISEVRKLRAAPAAQPFQWGPWIPWAGGECPIPDAKAGEYAVRFRGAATGGKYCSALDYYWGDDDDGTIAAYRVRIPADDLLRQAVEALRDVTNALESKIDTSEKFKRPYEHPLSAFDRARAVISLADERGL